MATSPATSNLTSTVHHSGYPFSSTSCSSRRMYDHTRINPHISSVVNSLSANSPLSSSPFHSWAPSASSFSSSSSSSSRIFAMPSDHNYSTLGVPVGASEEQIKKARRKLALKFHPDVCKEDSCAARFIQIEQAYETIMNWVRGTHRGLDHSRYESVDYCDGMMGVNDDSWEDWEEWMGWEGAGTRDYSSHINPSF